ncbi:hypothetical protein GCM10022408_07170 [Hymenobacter fastidiosus]|uniref:Uncharacterized protein n=1 Tax=Hymenobacter fastidiosus TaxID=486264 RepID=A0ABP7RKK3_9BACT
MAYWSLYAKPTTEEVILDANGDLKDRLVHLKHPCIELRKEDTGGMIYWNGKRYIWLHQGC